jgi:hypothetical protein
MDASLEQADGAAEVSGSGHPTRRGALRKILRFIVEPIGSQADNPVVLIGPGAWPITVARGERRALDS